MLGNVWEMCSDKSLVEGAYYGVPKPGGFVDPVADPSCRSNLAVICGGAWNSDYRSANSVMNTVQPILARNNDIGFRVKCMAGSSADAACVESKGSPRK